MAFSERYNTGQVVELQDNDGFLIATALVLDFDPTQSQGKISGMSKAGRPSPDHWHVAVQKLGTSEWLPAAIWDENDSPQGKFGLHITREHVRAELRNIPLAYTVDELERRVGGIAMLVSQIYPIGQLDLVGAANSRESL